MHCERALEACDPEREESHRTFRMTPPAPVVMSVLARDFVATWARSTARAN